MKQREFPLDERQISLFFTAVRDKSDVIKLLMHSVKIMLINDQSVGDRAIGKLILRVCSMSRLLFVSENKIFSINFPFQVYIGDDDSLSFSSHYCEDVDNKVTSEVLSVLDQGLRQSYDVLGFAEMIMDIEEASDDLWGLIRELMLHEDGYIRYDHDPQRADGRRHPLHHLDICYSASGTYKLGLNQEVDSEKLIDLLNIGSECHFLDSR